MRGDHGPRTKQTTAFASLMARAMPSWRVPSKNSVMMAFRGGLDRAESVATKKDVDRGEQSGKQRDRLASDPKTTNCQRLSLRNILSVQRESSPSALQYLIFHFCYLRAPCDPFSPSCRRLRRQPGNCPPAVSAPPTPHGNSSLSARNANCSSDVSFRARAS